MARAKKRWTADSICWSPAALPTNLAPEQLASHSLWQKEHKMLRSGRGGIPLRMEVSRPHARLLIQLHKLFIDGPHAHFRRQNVAHSRAQDLHQRKRHQFSGPRIRDSQTSHCLPASAASRNECVDCLCKQGASSSSRAYLTQIRRKQQVLRVPNFPKKIKLRVGQYKSLPHC